jgi:hypothetical protein
VLAGVALLGAMPAGAQLTLSADATRATVHYDGYQRSPVWLVSPVVRLEQRLLTLTGRGNLSVFESGNRSTDLMFAASLYPPSEGSWRAEITGTAGLSRYLDINTGYGTLGARAHRIARTAGIWLGASTTGVTGSTEVISGAQGEAGAWMRTGPLAMSVVGSLTGVADIRYVDAGLQARYTRGWLELAGGLGSRGGDRTLGLRAWGDISATVWLTRSLALVAGHGSYPSNPTQLSPGGQYTALSMRVATRPPPLREALTRTIGYPTPSIVHPVVAGFDVDRRRDGRTRIRVRAADAQSVEIMGNFTDWSPVMLERGRGDRWEIVLPLERGTHQLNIRVDGGPWGVPPGIGTAPDDFGGVVGLLVIT